MQGATIFIQPKCRICGKHRPCGEFVGDPAIGYCLDCHLWHQDALEVLLSQTGQCPKGCACCGTPYDALSARSPNGDVPMTMQKKDGVYQFLCQTCSDSYDRKQAQRYRGTPHGAQLGL